MNRVAEFNLVVLSGDTVAEMHELRKEYLDRGYTFPMMFNRNPCHFDKEAKRYSCVMFEYSGAITEVEDD